jgi:hypothetical protein
VVAEWYYQKGEREHGPIESRALLHLAATGQLRPDDLVRKQGMKTAVPADRVKGLSFPTPSRSGLQAEVVPAPPPVRVATPAATPKESIPVQSDVDWSSAFLLSIAFVCGAPLVFAVPLLLSIFAPLALLLIPLAAVVFLFVGPKRYRTRLGRFCTTLVSPRSWRLTTTGAAVGIAAGFMLSVFLFVNASRAIDKKTGSTISQAAGPQQRRPVHNESSAGVAPEEVPTQQPVLQQQLRPVEFAGLTLGCSVSDALNEYGNPETVKRVEDAAINRTYVELSGNPRVKNVRRTRLWFLDDRFYAAELEIRTSEEGAAGTEGQAWLAVLRERYGEGKAERDSDYVILDGRTLEKVLLCYVFSPSTNVTVTLKLPKISIEDAVLSAASNSRREQSERAGAQAKQSQAEEKIKASGF